MYIHNIKTGMVQECNNADVIKTCRKYPGEFAVAENAEQLLIQAENAAKEEKGKLSDFKVSELKELAKRRGINGADSLNKQELLEVLEGDGS